MREPSEALKKDVDRASSLLLPAPIHAIQNDNLSNTIMLLCEQTEFIIPELNNERSRDGRIEAVKSCAECDANVNRM
jgi:hypothetical protein